MSTIHTELSRIQQELIAPKNQYNKFGKYNYRSCEDILQGLKPVLGESSVTLNDEIVEVAGRVYVKATASLNFKGEVYSVHAMAREPQQKKGMDEAQVTGATSSYARKYALNGLFAIDDSKDADSKGLSVGEQILDCASIQDLTALWKSMSQKEQNENKSVFSARKAELS